MPRIDHLWPPEERDRERIRLSEYMSAAVQVACNQSVVNSYTWTDIVLDPWYVITYRDGAVGDVLTVWDAIHADSDRSHDRSILRVAIGPRFASREYPDTICACGGTNEGCARCRPDVWEECGCGDDLLIGYPCHCWFVCPICGDEDNDQRAFHAEPVWVALEGRNMEARACSASCAVEHGFQPCNSCQRPCNADNDDGLCVLCRPCECGVCFECGQRYRVHNYSYRPNPVFRGEGPLYLGLENEIDFPSYSNVDTYGVSRYLVDTVGGLAYLKSDGSLNRGFELVTHPMELRWAMEHYPWHMYEELRTEFGVEALETTGIHVHASRAGFSGSRHLYMWLKFFHRNADPIRRISRRDDGQWSSFSSEVRGGAAMYAKARPGDRAPYNAWYLPAEYRDGAEMNFRRWGYSETDVPMPSRYSAVNVLNEHTVEVRTFAGSVDATEIQAALQLVGGSIEYTRTLDAASVIKKSGWKWESFTAWLDGKPLYNSLNSEIERLVV